VEEKTEKNKVQNQNGHSNLENNKRKLSQMSEKSGISEKSGTSEQMFEKENLLIWSLNKFYKTI